MKKSKARDLVFEGIATEGQKPFPPNHFGGTTNLRKVGKRMKSLTEKVKNMFEFIGKVQLL
ncbi:hypothetical protein [Persicitalea sp.]|uniref:hypothetical protein n=1 Tax=Persicitalea sp. TaxID=3100273 RepID=UPI00359310DD